MHRNIVIGILTAAIFLNIGSAGLFASERAVTLKEALSLAMKDNPELRARKRGVAASAEDISIAGSYLLPKISLEERFMRTSTPAYAFSFKMNQERFSAQDLMGAPDTFNHPGASTDIQTAVSFEQPLFAPKAYIGLDMAKKEASAQQGDLSRRHEDVALKVYKTFLGIEAAAAYVRAAEKGIEDANAHLRVAEFRYKEGVGIYSDKLRAEVGVSMAKERHVSATRNRDTAKRALGLMLGLSESLEIISEERAFVLKDLAYYHALSSARTDLKAMQSRVSNAGNMVKMADAGYLPVIGIGAGYQLNDHKKVFGSEGESWQLMAFLKWELFDGTKREHERQKAEHKQGEAQEYLEGMKKEIAFNIYDAYLAVGEARDSLALARASLSSSEEGLRIVRSRYENSLSPMLELLDMQANLDVSRALVVEKEASYNMALANLWFQSGSILSELDVRQ